MAVVKMWDNKEWVHKRYVLERKTVLQMALEARCSHMTIQRALERWGYLKKPKKIVKPRR